MLNYKGNLWVKKNYVLGNKVKEVFLIRLNTLYFWVLY